MKIICSSCGTVVTGQEDFVKMQCPECGEETIIRCKRCKKMSNTYVCKRCGFEGP